LRDERGRPPDRAAVLGRARGKQDHERAHGPGGRARGSAARPDLSLAEIAIRWPLRSGWPAREDVPGLGSAIRAAPGGRAGVTSSLVRVGRASAPVRPPDQALRWPLRVAAPLSGQAHQGHDHQRAAATLGTRNRGPASSWCTRCRASGHDRVGPARNAGARTQAPARARAGLRRSPGGASARYPVGSTQGPPRATPWGYAGMAGVLRSNTHRGSAPLPIGGP
jgi:hypothetical protein